MKPILTGIAGIILGAGTVGLAGTVDTVDTAKLQTDKQAVLDENIELHSRFAEPAVLDLNVATAEEVSQAYANVANEYGVTLTDLNTAKGNVQAAIQEKLAGTGLMCVK